MNPILKKLSTLGITPSMVADLLEKHVGDATNEQNCKQAFEALKRIKTRELAIPTQVLAKLKGDNLRYGELITYTIQRLRFPE